MLEGDSIGLRLGWSRVKLEVGRAVPCAPSLSAVKGLNALP